MARSFETIIVDRAAIAIDTTSLWVKLLFFEEVHIGITSARLFVFALLLFDVF